MRNVSPYLVALIVYAGLHSLVNPLPGADWVTVRCQHLGCSPNDVAFSRALLIWFGFSLVTVIVFGLLLLFRHFLLFVLLVTVAGGVSVLVMGLATSAGDNLAFYRGVSWMLGSFLMIMGAPVTMAASRFGRARR